MPRTHFLALFAAFFGFIVLTLRPLAKLLANTWRQLPTHCVRCCHAVPRGSVSAGERMAWCPRCQHVFDVPLLKAPSWVTGVLAILLLNLQ